MEVRTDRGWIKASLAVLVTGVLGGGVIAVVGDPRTPHKLTAEGVTGSPPPAGASPTSPAPGPATAPEPEKKSDPEVGDKVMVGDDGGSVTVSAVEDNISAGRLFGAGEGNKYIAAEVKGCSGPDEKKISFEPAYFLLRLDDGTVHDPGAPAKKPSLEGGTIPAGKCLSGWVTFTVKEGSLATAVIYDGSSRITWTAPLPKNAKPTTTTTLKPGAATTTTGAVGDGTKATTSTTKPKTTTTTAKTTATTARGSTATTAKTTASTSKSSTTTSGKPSSPSTTATTAKSSASTTTTSNSSSGSTPTSSPSPGTKSSGSTTTTGKPAAAPQPDASSSE
jgi:hypothetical protein